MYPMYAPAAYAVAPPFIAGRFGGVLAAGSGQPPSRAAMLLGLELERSEGQPFDWDRARKAVSRLVRDDPSIIAVAHNGTDVQFFRRMAKALYENESDMMTPPRSEKERKDRENALLVMRLTRQLIKDWYPYVPDMPLAAAAPNPLPVPMVPPPMQKPAFLCPPGKSDEGMIYVINRTGPLFFRVYRVEESLFCIENEPCVKKVLGAHSPAYQVGPNRKACIYYKRLGFARPGTTLRIFWSNKNDLRSTGPEWRDSLDKNNTRILTGREIVHVGPRDVTGGNATPRRSPISLLTAAPMRLAGAGGWAPTPPPPHPLIPSMQHRPLYIRRPFLRRNYFDKKFDDFCF